MTREEIRERADSVMFGECITWPDGMVIDKRPAPQTFVPYNPPPPNPVGWANQ